MSDISKMKELIYTLNEAAKVYYQGQDEIMSNYDYDNMYDELKELEEKTGTILSNSPTQRVGYEVLSELPKFTHERPMLSLDKTKEREELRQWLGDKEGLLSWKLDGLTVVLTYEAGELTMAVTRGNGVVGEVITANARTFTNVPLRIPYKGKLVLRGEAVITYSQFEKINNELPEEEKYKNPRNLCSGSVRQLDSSVTAARKVSFFAFSLVSATENGISPDFNNSNEDKCVFLKNQGFDVVSYERVNKDNILEKLQLFQDKIIDNDFPSDGLVLLLDDIAYGESLGSTAKFPRNAIAFKWQDETMETSLIYVEWNASRTGLINPIAVFEPVELEGTTVQRASVHNVSIVKQLKLGEGDKIKVYKANMIIPQISENLTMSDTLRIPDSCPVCGCKTELLTEAGSTVLMCPNSDCAAKQINFFELFVSRDAMNIEGLSVKTIEKFIERGLISEPADIYRLKDHKEEILAMEGFKEKSFENICKSVDDSKNPDLPNFINALGISNVGLSTARIICRYFSYDFDKIREASADEMCEIDGIGDITAKSISDFFADEKNIKIIDNLLNFIIIKKVNMDSEAGDDLLTGLTFVVTGSLNHYENRSVLKKYIEDKGGKVSGSVSSKTSYLINNDNKSRSSKNKKAIELQIPIITEEEFMERFT